MANEGPALNYIPGNRRYQDTRSQDGHVNSPYSKSIVGQHSTSTTRETRTRKVVVVWVVVYGHTSAKSSQKKMDNPHWALGYWVRVCVFFLFF